jgi:glycosyltransferase involved in cell wall biosynthesis
VVVATCRLLGVPVLRHLHARMDGFYRRLPGPLQRLTRRVFHMASAVVVIGPAAREFVLDVLRVPPSRVEMIINGVPEATAPPQPAQSPPGPCRVLFLGNLSERKGLVDLLFALAQPGLDTRALAVTIAGGGDVARYRRLAAELGVAGVVRFEGWCDQAKTRRLLARAHVLALPSHDEVLPLAVLEALAHGVAVLTTPVGEIPALLTDGVDALFVPPGDPAAIARALQRVTSDPVLMRGLARNGRLLYQQHFSLAGFFTRVASVHRRHFGVAAQLGQPAVADARVGPAVGP